MAGSRQQRDWEDLSALDPYWAILSDSQRRFGGWDAESFGRSGADAVEKVLRDGDRFGVPRGRGDALDFGCGAGRLTIALSREFDRCLGLDVSARMVHEARARAEAAANCRFAVSDAPDLRAHADGSFDLVLSRLVLQHIPSAAAKLRLIGEFVRVLRPGGLLAFQLPSAIPARHRLQPRPRTYALLRRAGVSRATLYGRLHLHPIRMSHLGRARVLAAIEAADGRVLEARDEPAAGGSTSTDYLATRDG